MNSRKISIGLILIIVLALQMGCSVRDNQEEIQKNVMDEFGALINTHTELIEVIEFIDDNIKLLSKENVSIMINHLEEIQKRNLPKLDGKFYSSQNIQSEMEKIYKPGFDINKINHVDDKQLKDLLTETRDTGYKIETAEGMYFPIIDYQFYKKYSPYVTADMKAYIDIMEVESSKMPAKDAALVIGWNEILERTLRHGRFIEKYPDSIKINDVRQLYKRYISFTLFGLNNTPLFSYDSKTMADDAKNAYMQAVEINEDSEYMTILKGFMDALEKDDYKLTDEVDKYRKSVSL